MFKSLSLLVPKDNSLPERAWMLTVLQEFYDDTIYDRLPHEFHEERTEAGEYIPIAKRAPSVRYALPQIVVRDSVSFLFAEGRWPSIDCADDEQAEKTLSAIIKDTKLNEVMLDAAEKGAVGSVCIWLRVLGNRIFFSALRTTFLTPTFKPDAPDQLVKVTERYKVKGQALRDLGYAIDAGDTAADFWFQRIWDETSETWFLPSKVSDDASMVEDSDRSVVHGLGFVPMIWVRNLPGGNEIDGACTFRAAIPNGIEINYQLSQAGRGLKYSSSPTLVIRDDSAGQGKSTKHIVGDALMVPSDGDAKLLEIGGDAAKAVISYASELRKMALESVGGSRADSDKLSAATSGRAMELMNQALINLADKLRSSYGEGALLKLLKMVATVSRKISLIDSDGVKIPEIPANTKIALIWPKWFAPTADDRQADALAVTTLTAGGVLSKETAVASVSSEYDIEDVQEELARLKNESDAAIEAQQAMKPTPEQIPTPKPAK